MKTFLKYLSLILLAFLLIPMSINWILGLTTPFSINVTGEGKDWVPFYGSYYGSIITASISFIILNRTISHNKKEAEIVRKKQDLESLENLLAEHITLINFYKIGAVTLVLNDDSLTKAEILKLESFNFELIRKSNSLHLIFEGKPEQYAINYIANFDKCIDRMTKDINNMTHLISELPKRESLSDDLDKRIEITERIKREILKHNSHKIDYAEPVYNAAKEWLKIERAAFDKSRN